MADRRPPKIDVTPTLVSEDDARVWELRASRPGSFPLGTSAFGNLRSFSGRPLGYGIGE